MTEARASFKSFEESTRDDWAIISVQLDVTQRMVADRILEQLRYLASDHGGFPVSRLEHSLQTATRAERDGRDEEYLMCALLHDIGDTLAPYNHPQIGAAIVKPFVSEANHWMVEHHGIFQGYYFWHHIGMDRNTRDALPRLASTTTTPPSSAPSTTRSRSTPTTQRAARLLRAAGAPVLRACVSRAKIAPRPTCHCS